MFCLFLQPDLKIQLNAEQEKLVLLQLLGFYEWTLNLGTLAEQQNPPEFGSIATNTQMRDKYVSWNLNIHLINFLFQPNV